MKQVSYVSFLGPRSQTCREDLLLLVSLPLEMARQRVPACGAEPQLEHLSGFRVHPASLKVLPGPLAAIRFQEASEEIQSRLVRPVQRLLPFPGLWGGYRHTGAVRQLVEGLGEVQVLSLHSEGDDVSTLCAGPKAAPGLPVREDVERRRLLSVEGAGGLEVAPRLRKHDAVGDHVYYVAAAFDVLDYGHGLARGLWAQDEDSISIVADALNTPSRCRYGDCASFAAACLAGDI